MSEQTMKKVNGPLPAPPKAPAPPPAQPASFRERVRAACRRGGSYWWPTTSGGSEELTEAEFEARVRLYEPRPMFAFDAWEAHFCARPYLESVRRTPTGYTLDPVALPVAVVTGIIARARPLFPPKTCEKLRALETRWKHVQEQYTVLATQTAFDRVAVELKAEADRVAAGETARPLGTDLETMKLGLTRARAALGLATKTTAMETFELLRPGLERLRDVSRAMVEERDKAERADAEKWGAVFAPSTTLKALCYFGAKGWALMIENFEPGTSQCRPQRDFYGTGAELW